MYSAGAIKYICKYISKMYDGNQTVVDIESHQNYTLIS